MHWTESIDTQKFFSEAPFQHFQRKIWVSICPVENRNGLFDVAQTLVRVSNKVVPNSDAAHYWYKYRNLPVTHDYWFDSSLEPRFQREVINLQLRQLRTFFHRSHDLDCTFHGSSPVWFKGVLKFHAIQKWKNNHLIYASPLNAFSVSDANDSILDKVQAKIPAICMSNYFT